MKKKVIKRKKIFDWNSIIGMYGYPDRGFLHIVQHAKVISNADPSHFNPGFIVVGHKGKSLFVTHDGTWMVEYPKERCKIK